MLLNPYIAGNPVGKTPAFVGREDVVREVLRVLRDPHHSAMTLYGQRRIGKTSILQHLEDILPHRGPYLPVYFDLQNRAAWPLGRVLEELARTIAERLDLPWPDLDRNSETAFRETWLPQALEHLPRGHSLVLLFDEFDVLADPEQDQAARAFFPYLRELLDHDPARLQFVFVLGRNIRDLSHIALALFKGVPTKRVSLLPREDTEALVRLAERNGSLRWPRESVDRVWELTHGHPYLTQALCWEVWERLHEEEPEEPPVVRPDDVDAAVPATLERSANALQWLWDGLGPAEKVVAAALAQAGPGPVTEESLTRILQESGVRLVIRELEEAPRLLQEWDILEPADPGYRFRVELLRRWIAQRYPPTTVQKELDYLEPAAENLYRAAYSLYQAGNLEASQELLERALTINPNHGRAMDLLSTIYLSQGELDKAQELLERLQEVFPAMARPRLVQLYLKRAEQARSPEEKLRWYEGVLRIDPHNQESLQGLCSAEVKRLQALEREERYTQALEQAEALREKYPALGRVCPELMQFIERMQKQVWMEARYQQALGALEQGHPEEAIPLLLEVLHEDPHYKEATRYLHIAVTGEDVWIAAIQQQLREALAELKRERQQRQNQETLKPAKKPQQERSKQKQLSPWNPLDWFRLLWWLLVTPVRFHEYKEQFGEKALHRSGAYLASTLAWLPLFWPALGLGLERLPLAQDISLTSREYLFLSLFALPGLWLLTGILDIASEKMTGTTAFLAAVVAFVVASVGSMLVFVAINMADVVMLNNMAVVVAGSIAFVVAVVLGAMASGGAAIGVAGSMYNGILESDAGVASIVACGLSYFMVLGVVLDVMYAIKNQHSSRLTLPFLAFSHAFLIWFSLLGGAQVLSG